MREIPERDDIYGTALHEAGHAVIHHLLGNKVSFVTMCNGDNDGMVTAENHSDANLVIGGFAGPWAQKLFADEPPTLSECSHDFHLIDQTLGISSAQDPQVSLCEELKARSREMVLANEKNIRAVADFLIAYGSLGDPAHSYGMTATEILNSIIRTTSPSI